MGEVSKRLHKRLSSKHRRFPVRLPQGFLGEPLPGDVKNVRTLIRDGLDPVHAAYTFIQQISSVFAERVSDLPELREYEKLAGAAEDEYMPSAPPMSPLTSSYFTTWAFYDLRFGPDGDTIGQCMIDANDLIGLDPEQLDALRKMSGSRMGIYEQVGMDGPLVRLRELLTEDEFRCHPPTGYQGTEGDLWYVRLLPPLAPGPSSYSVAFTTPYVLRASKADWESFLRRALPPFQAGGDRDALHPLFKFGPELNYWHEFIFLAYHHHQFEAIFLAGIPDRKETLPHA